MRGNCGNTNPSIKHSLELEEVLGEMTKFLIVRYKIRYLFQKMTITSPEGPNSHFGVI